MTLDDLKKLATSGTIFNLDRMIAPKIIKLLYLLGLGGIGLWAIRHLFGSFAQSFGAGIWGILEIGIVGLGSFVLLRVICETLLVFFKKNETHITLAPTTRPAMSIFDDVKDALEELADEEVEFKEQKVIEPVPAKAPVRKTVVKKPAAKRAPARKRTPKPKAD
ncbi:DUF4282 domain-containing protein [Maritalea sp.]|uniref:DUF4282 domain-containing protein n=1 Tax=Maritalea sp. TaxID=2003361 RepID=UPI003EF672B2